MTKYDLAIIGAGPGGYTAAIRAGQLGKKVALIERGEVGGVCLNRGCIPTKALIASTNLFRKILNADEFGLDIEDSPRIDFKKIQERKEGIVNSLQQGIVKLIKGNGVEIIKGNARLKAADEIDVEGQKIKADTIIVATGSCWIELPNIKPDGEHILTSDEALTWDKLPTSVVIIGGGYIGCEFTSMLNSAGVGVTIVEAMDSLMPMVEKRISSALAREYKKRGIKIITGTKVESAHVKEGQVEYTLMGGETNVAEKMLIAVGRRVDVSDLDIEKVGLKLGSRGELEVNERFETNVKGIRAIGDVNGGVMLAHAASEQAIACVDDMFGQQGPEYDDRFVPACIFSAPEIAYVGRTAQELENDGVSFKTGKFAFAALGKALIEGSPEGQVIVHARDDGKILGVHVIGTGAIGIVAEATLAVKNGLTVKDIEATIHAHPTMSEAFAEAIRDVDGGAIHKLIRKSNPERK
jgi:dihydrolipoamide dehydrogenase